MIVNRGFLVLILLVVFVRADEEPVSSSSKNEIPIYASKIGTNLFNSYDYFEKMKAPKGEKRMHGIFSSEKMFRLLTIDTNLPEGNKTIYSLVVDEKTANEWKKMAEKNYWYSLTTLDTWLFAPFGNFTSSPEIFLHKTFYIRKHNGTFDVLNVTSSNSSPIIEGKNISFTYSSVILENTEKQDTDVYVHKDMMFFALLYFLCAAFCLLLWRLVVIPLFAQSRYDDESVFSTSFAPKELTWKLLSSDVFRRTRSGVFLSAISGAGAHYLLCLVLGATVRGTLIFQKAHFTHSFYFLLSYIFGGAVSGYLLVFNGVLPLRRKMWINCFVINIVLVSIPLVIFDIGNVIRLIYFNEVTLATFRVVFLSLVNSTIFCVPVEFCGIVLGRFVAKQRKYGKKNHHVNQVPRLTPRLARNNKIKVITLGSGFISYLPIAQCYNDLLSYIFLFKPFSLSSLSLVSIYIFLFLTFCEAILGTFMYLNAEQHKWKWWSFRLGSSAGYFLLAHSLVFFFLKIFSLNVFIFFLFMLQVTVFSVVFSLICGSISFFSASCFIEYIYEHSTTSRK